MFKSKPIQMKKVTVTADPSGQAIVPSANNSEFGYVRVAQTRNIVDERGWLRNKPVAALILGSVSDLKEAGYKANQELEGKIIIRESLTPFNKKSPEKDLKVAGKTGITCMVGEKPIYRKAFFSQDPQANDELLPAVYETVGGKKVSHTNAEEIGKKYAADLLAQKGEKAKL